LERVFTCMTILNFTSPLKKTCLYKALCLAIIMQTGCFFSAFAQYDSLLHKSYGENIYGIHAMYNDLIQIPDSASRAKQADVIKDFARKHQDKALERNVDFFLVFWNAFYQRQPKEISLRKLKTQLEQSTQDNIEFLRARSLRALAEFYWKIEKNYELAFEQYLLLDQELTDNIHPDAYPEMARDLMQIGEAYYFFRDYPVAKKYFKKVIAIPENDFNSTVINAARNNLGLCYQQQNQPDSSDFYFNQVLKTTFPQSAAWKRVATGNLGYNRYLQQDFENAKPLLEADFNEAVAENDPGDAAGSAITLADIYLENGDIEAAKSFIERAQEYLHKADQPDRLRQLYPVMSKWYAATGNWRRAKLYVDSSILAIDRYNEKFNALQVLRAQQKVDRQQEELQLAAFNLERERKLAERNLLILLVVILSVVLILMYFVQKKRQLSKDLKLQAATQDLEIARLNLNSFTESILEKNNLIEQLQNRNPDEDKSSLIQQLQQSTILTEEDWQDFQLLFDKAYPGLILRFREQYQELSVGELRYFVLSRLNISTKEMAGMLGVSANAIQVMRHRIRKKLNLPENISLEEMIKEM